MKWLQIRMWPFFYYSAQMETKTILYITISQDGFIAGDSDNIYLLLIK